MAHKKVKLLSSHSQWSCLNILDMISCGIYTIGIAITLQAFPATMQLIYTAISLVG